MPCSAEEKESEGESPREPSSFDSLFIFLLCAVGLIAVGVVSWHVGVVGLRLLRDTPLGGGFPPSLRPLLPSFLAALAMVFVYGYLVWRVRMFLRQGVARVGQGVRGCLQWCWGLPSRSLLGAWILFGIAIAGILSYPRHVRGVDPEMDREVCCYVIAEAGYPVWVERLLTLPVSPPSLAEAIPSYHWRIRPISLLLHLCLSFAFSLLLTVLLRSYSFRESP